MTVLETERLRLRRLTPADVDPLLSIFSDPLAMRYYPGTKDAAETRLWIDWNLDLYERHGHGLFAAILRENGRFAGQVGLVVQQVGGVEETEIGYLFRREFWGRGLATEGARACRDFAFEVLGKHRLVSLIDPANAPSRRVAERIGMHLEGQVSKWGKRVCVYAVEKRDRP